jgi:hypothetical protein
MRRSIVKAAVAAVAVLAATATGITVASAAGSTPTEHVTFLQTHASGDPVVIAQGPVHARGKDIAVSPRKDRLVFPNGNLIVRHSRVGKAFDSFDPTTCYGRHRERGTYRIVRGTGAYRGAHGRGIYRLHIHFVGCSQTKPPKLFELVINASGPLHM